MLVYRNDEAQTRYYGDEKRVGILGDCARWSVTEIPPRRKQNAHRHKYFTEILYVVRGTLRLYEWDHEELHSQLVYNGDLVIFTPGNYHKLSNESDELTVLHTVKIITDSSIIPQKFRQLINQDWEAMDNTGN